MMPADNNQQSIRVKVIMQKLPIVSIVHINSKLNHMRTTMLLKRLSGINRPSVLALIVSSPSQSPIQIYRIVEQLKHLRKQQGLQVLGFTRTHCTPQSYYLLSSADRIYTSPTTVFILKRTILYSKITQLLDKLSLSQSVACSQPNLARPNFDTILNTNQKWGEQSQHDSIDRRIFSESVANREQMVGNLNLKFQEVDSVMLGKDMLLGRLVDGYGCYQEVLQQHYPQFENIRNTYSGQKIALLGVLFFLTSPILLLIFLGKATLKWSLIFYAWLNSKEKSLKQIEEEYEAALLQKAHQNSPPK